MDLKNFFKENVKKVENIKFVVSERYSDENGKALEWEIQPISNKLDDKLRNEATITIKGKRGMNFDKLDNKKYLKSIVVNAVIYPNLNDKELQDSYGVMGAEDLIDEMLLAGEFSNLVEKINEISGFDVNVFEEKVKEAKN